ncbi:hypothetical protein GCM10027570_52710 [Streptomonospora sediminis]
MAAVSGGQAGDRTHLSVVDTARLAAVAGKLHAAAFAAADDQVFLRALLADALADVDQVRGRCTAVAAARPWPIGQAPAVPRTRAGGSGRPPGAGGDRAAAADPRPDRDGPDPGTGTARPGFPT